jgi:hypothetical protein
LTSLSLPHFRYWKPEARNPSLEPAGRAAPSLAAGKKTIILPVHPLLLWLFLTKYFSFYSLHLLVPNVFLLVPI